MAHSSTALDNAITGKRSRGLTHKSLVEEMQDIKIHKMQ